MRKKNTQPLQINGNNKDGKNIVCDRCEYFGTDLTLVNI